MICVLPISMWLFTSLAPHNKVCGIFGFRYNREKSQLVRKVKKYNSTLSLLIWLAFQLAQGAAIVNAILLANTIRGEDCYACFIEIYAPYAHYFVASISMALFLSLMPPREIFHENTLKFFRFIGYGNHALILANFGEQNSFESSF